MFKITKEHMDNISGGGGGLVPKSTREEECVTIVRIAKTYTEKFEMF